MCDVLNRTLRSKGFLMNMNDALNATWRCRNVVETERTDSKLHHMKTTTKNGGSNSTRKRYGEVSNSTPFAYPQKTGRLRAQLACDIGMSPNTLAARGTRRSTDLQRRAVHRTRIHHQTA